MACARCKLLAAQVAELQVKVDSFHVSRAAYMRDYRKQKKPAKSIPAVRHAPLPLPILRHAEIPPGPQIDLSEDDELGPGRWI